MKKLVLFLGIAVTAILTFVYVSYAYLEGPIHAYSDTGWVSSNGATFMDGLATQIQEIQGGYSVVCDESGFVCFEIDGNDLWIYGIGHEGGGYLQEPVYVEITEAPANP